MHFMGSERCGLGFYDVDEEEKASIHFKLISIYLKVKSKRQD